MKALVTGHNGFIGSTLIEALDQRGIDWIGIDNERGLEPADDLVMIRKSHGWDRRIKAFQPDTVFHLAALHFVPWCREHPVETMLTNERGTANVLISLAHHTEVKRVVLASSAAVYGFGRQRFTEKDPLNPVDVYGRSKVSAETIVHNFTRGMPGTVGVAARLSNVIGQGDEHEHILPKIMDQPESVVVGNLYPLRDYIYVGDVVEALIAAAETELHPGFHTLNVSTGIGSTVLDLLTFAGVDEYEWGPGRADDGDLVLDPRKMHRVLNYKAETTVPEVIAKWQR